MLIYCLFFSFYYVPAAHVPRQRRGVIGHVDHFAMIVGDERIEFFAVDTVHILYRPGPVFVFLVQTAQRLRHYPLKQIPQLRPDPGYLGHCYLKNDHAFGPNDTQEFTDISFGVHGRDMLEYDVGIDHVKAVRPKSRQIGRVIDREYASFVMRVEFPGELDHANGYIDADALFKVAAAGLGQAPNPASEVKHGAAVHRDLFIAQVTHDAVDLAVTILEQLLDCPAVILFLGDRKDGPEWIAAGEFLPVSLDVAERFLGFVYILCHVPFDAWLKPCPTY